MKKGIIYVALTVFFICCITGCSSHSSKEDMNNEKMIPVSQMHPGRDKLAGIIKLCPNLKMPEELSVEVPSKLTEIVEYTANYSLDASMKEYDREFREMYEYLFPDHPLDEDYLFYCGGHSDAEYDDNTGELVRDYYKWKDWKQQILSGEEGQVYYFYDEARHQSITKQKPAVYLELGNPIGYGYTFLNKGKTIALNGSKVEKDIQYDPTYYLEYVDSYAPDSKQKYKLADREMSVCDAVKFFENYINHLPCPQEKNVKTIVVSVDVYRVNKNIYGYNMMTTKECRGIPFDHIREGSYDGRLGYDDYSGTGGSAFMVESDDADIINGYYAKEDMRNIRKYSEIFSLESAIRFISKKMTKHVTFTVRKIELVYSQKDKKTKEGYVDIKNRSARMKPAWKLTLENTNDELSYICYIDAADGGNFRYCTTPTKWWEDDQI